MKTAMQELIDELKYQFSHSDNHLQTIVNIVQKAESQLFEKEKEQIKDAYDAALERPIEDFSEAYYNMNYKCE